MLRTVSATFGDDTGVPHAFASLKVPAKTTQEGSWKIFVCKRSTKRENLIFPFFYSFGGYRFYKKAGHCELLLRSLGSLFQGSGGGATVFIKRPGTVNYY